MKITISIENEDISLIIGYILAEMLRHNLKDTFKMEMDSESG